MTKKFSELRAQMSPESRARAETKAQTMLAEMPLNELSQARGLSQKMLAELLPSVTNPKETAPAGDRTFRIHGTRVRDEKLTRSCR